MRNDAALAAFERATDIYQHGSVDEALVELDEAERLASGPSDRGLLAGILVQRLGWLRDGGRPEERPAVLARLHELLPHLSGAERDPALMGLRLEQGIDAKAAGDFEAAETLLRQAESDARAQAAGASLLSDILANLASLHLLAGRVERAQTTIRDAIDRDRASGNDRALTNDLNLLGLIYDVTGEHATANLYLKEALEVATRGGFPKEAADAQANSAVYLENAGRLVEARAAYETALRTYQQIGNDIEAVNAKSSLAIVAAKLDDIVTARRLFEETIREHEALGDYVHADYDRLNLAQAELSLGTSDRALDLVDDAYVRARQRGMLDLVWRTLALRIRANTDQLKKAASREAQLEGLQEMLRHYEEATDALDLLRSSIGRPEERQQFLLNKEDLYGEGMMLAGTLGQAETAFAFSDRSRARAFLDVMGPGRIEKRARRSPLLLRRHELTTQITASDGTTASRELYDQLRVVRAQIAAEQPAEAALTEAVMPPIQEIAQGLPADTAVVEFFVGPGNHLTVFVVDSNGLRSMNTLDLGTIVLADLVAQFRTELRDEVEGTPTGKELLLILFSAVWDGLEGVDRLLIVPHRELHYLPFAALWFDNAGAGPKRLYFCQRFMHAVLPSAAALPLYLKLPRPPLEKGRGRVIANPTGDLPDAEEEGLAVARQLGVPALTRDQATRAAMLQPKGDVGVVHVASHGVFDALDPLLSGVVLADGRVTAEDLLESRIGAGLLTLSGCVTGLAKRQPGDELIGLSRAAAFAGIPSVVTSLWDVWDESSKQFFIAFYEALGRGQSKDLAMLHAQHTLLSQERFAHPVHWAPFVLLGDWR